MLSPLVLLLALTAVVSAKTGDMLLECPSADWKLYNDRYEASCLRLMSHPRLFDDAFQACFALHSRMLSLLHKRDKILFVNDLIMKLAGENHTLWFFDPLDTHKDLVKHRNHASHSQEARWLVISPNADKSKIELLVNMTSVPRNFICEAPARPAAQRAQMEREPEDVFIADESLLPPHLPMLPASDNETEFSTTEKPQATKPPTTHKRLPAIITFNCQAYGIPKPDVHWVLVSDEEGSKLSVNPINATIIHDARLPISDVEAGSAPQYFNLQRDCKRHTCPQDNIQERSQLIVVNPQELLLPLAGSKRGRRIACIASNDFGSVISREAQILPARLGEFENRTEKVVLTIGEPEVVPNPILVEPDVASAECFRVIEGARRRPPHHSEAVAKLVPMEEVNQATRGGLQMSMATFDLIVDAAAPDDAGDYVCQVGVRNGRLGRVTRERTISLEVRPCVRSPRRCDLSAKPVSVVPGYPVMLSMNPLSNRLVRHGDDFQLECPCTGKRHPAEEIKVEWNLHNRTDIKAVILPVLPEGSRILIPDAESLTHAGLYQCRCRRGSDVSDWSSVQVNVLPPLSPSQHRDVIRVPVGKTATINCHVEPVDEAVTVFVQLMRGIQQFAAESERFTIERKSAGHLRLSIANATEADADVYGCRVEANFAAGWTDFNTYYTTLMVDKVL